MSNCDITGFYLLQTPSDGHCLLHAILGSWAHQVFNHHPPSLHDIKCSIFTETTTHMEKYLAFIPHISKRVLTKQLNDYIIHRKYNSAFGDLVPYIIANALSISINIHNHQDDGSYSKVSVIPDSSISKLQLSIHRMSDHFSILKRLTNPDINRVNHRLQSWPMAPTCINPPQVSISSVIHGHRPGSTVDPHTISQPVRGHGPLGGCGETHRQQPRPVKSPYSHLNSPRVSLMSQPDVSSVSDGIHRQQTRPVDVHHTQRGTQPDVSSVSCSFHRQQSRPVGTDNNPRSMSKITYSSEQLHLLRPASNSIHRNVRKSLFECGIWKPKNSKNHSDSTNINTTTKNNSQSSNSTVNHQLLRSLPKDYSHHQNILKFAMVNAQSLRNKVEDFTHSVTASSYDVCLVTETWLRNNDMGDEALIAQLRINGYDFLHSPRAGNNRGGGLGILFRKPIKAKVVKACNYPSFEMCIWDVTCKNLHFLVVGVYRPPYSPKHRVTVSKFVSEFSEVLSDLLGLYHNSRLIFAGDFNIHVNNNQQPDSIAFNDLLASYDCKQYIETPTHTSGNTLDLCIVPHQSQLSVNNISQDDYLSDHCFISFNINVTRPPVAKVPVKFRKLKAINRDDLRADLDLVCNDLIKLEGEALAHSYDTELKALLNKHAPVVSKLVPDRKKVAWFDAEANNLRKDVRKLENKWKKSSNPDDLANMKNARRLYRKTLREKKSTHFKEAIYNAKGNNRQLYAVTNGLMGKDRKNPLPPANSDADLAEDFASFFLNKTEKIREDLKDIEKYQPKGRSLMPLDHFEPLPSDKVKKVLNKSRATTCDSDPLPSSIIKENVDILSSVITKMVNNSLSQGIFYDDWKLATVQPLLKSPTADLILSQYRPVSNLSFISKLVEKCGIEQLNKHLTTNDLHSLHQSAYKENFSTETALCWLFTQLLWCMEQGNVSIMVALDLSAAFDTVEHETLCTVLEKDFGVTNTSLHWVKSYLNDRKMSVKVNDSKSSIRTFNFSVPQGSCLGPLLFNIYSSTIADCVDQTQDIGGYADDHFVRGNFNPNSTDAEKECIDLLEKSLVDIHQWMQSNTLKMNASKTDVSFFGSKNMLKKTSSTSIKVNGVPVEISDGLKYLGVWLDSSLSMKHHIDNKIKIAAGNIRRISNIRHFIDLDTAKLLACSLVLSHLDYANSILSGLPASTIARLQRVQNWAAKMVLRRGKYESSTEALKSLHWLPIKYRIDFKILCLVFRCLEDTAPKYLSDMLKKYNPGRPTRSQSENHLSVPFTKNKTFADRAFNVYGPNLWNELPPHIKLINNYHTFKASLKTILFKRAFKC